MVVVLPVVTVPSEFTVLVFLSGLAGLTAESPNVSPISGRAPARAAALAGWAT